jgi:hypothetical protein
MEAMMKHRNLVWWALLALLAFALVCAAGCEDETARMAKQQLAMGSKKQANKPNTPASTKSDDTSKAGQDGKDAAKDAVAATDAKPGEGEEAPAEEEYTGPKILVNVLETKAPYPEFEGKGRYTLKIDVSSEEMIDRAVWDILFFDKDGNKVASDRQELKIPMGDRPMVLKFSGLFCMAKPETVELRKTDYKATAAAEQGKKSEGGGGAGSSSSTGGSKSSTGGSQSSTGGKSGGGGSKSGGGGGKSGGGGGKSGGGGEEEDPGAAAGGE